MPTLYPAAVFPRIKTGIPNGSGLLWSRQQSRRVVAGEAPGDAAYPLRAGRLRAQAGAEH